MIIRLAIAVLASAVVGAALALSPGLPARAETPPESTNGSAVVSERQLADLSPDQIAQGLAELKASPVPRTTAVAPTGVTTTYDLGRGLTLTVVDPMANQRLGGGFERDGQFYVSFNQFDQDMLLSGAGFGLGAAICAIPGVGWLACTVVGAIITVGVVAVSYNAKCPGNKQLIVHVNPSWTTCR